MSVLVRVPLSAMQDIESPLLGPGYLDMARAEAKAEEFEVRTCSVEGLLADPEIQIVVNLTVPRAYAEVNLAAVQAGKNAHCEKPFAVYREDGTKVLRATQEKGVLVGHGHERWHPDPGFFYQVGGGPMFDMGPYYLTVLVNLLGPVRRVTGSARITFPERTITSEPRYGEKLTVETPTHLAGVLDFAGGAGGTIIASFDVWSHHLPRIEIYGSEGSLSVPDPNTFRGPVLVRRAGAEEWSEVPLTHSDAVSRGIGVADMAYALTYKRPHRTSGELTFHVLDLMCALDEASKSDRHIEIQSTCSRPAPLPMDLLPGTLDQ